MQLVLALGPNGAYLKVIMSNEVDTKAADPPQRELSAEARRALVEAEGRRKEATAQMLRRELGGRGGQDPVRYGDWEIKGLACDF